MRGSSEDLTTLGQPNQLKAHPLHQTVKARGCILRGHDMLPASCVGIRGMIGVLHLHRDTK